MSKRWTEVAIRFRRAPLSLFQGTDVADLGPQLARPADPARRGHILAIRRQAPWTERRPGAGQNERAYKDWFRALPNVGYETLIYDCMIGDATLFQRADMVRGGLAHRPVAAGGLGGGKAG